MALFNLHLKLKEFSLIVKLCLELQISEIDVILTVYIMIILSMVKSNDGNIPVPLAVNGQNESEISPFS